MHNLAARVAVIPPLRSKRNHATISCCQRKYLRHAPRIHMAAQPQIGWRARRACRSSDRNGADGLSAKLAGRFPVRSLGTDSEFLLTEPGAVRGRSRPRFSGSAGRRQTGRRRVYGPVECMQYDADVDFNGARDAGARPLGISLGRRRGLSQDRSASALRVNQHETLTVSGLNAN